MVMGILAGLPLIVIVRCFLSAAMIRMDVLWAFRMMVMPVVASGVGVLDHQGRATVSNSSEKRGKHHQPTREDCMDAVFFLRTHGGVGSERSPRFKRGWLRKRLTIAGCFGKV